MKQINIYVALKNNSDVQNILITRCSNNSNLMKKQFTILTALTFLLTYFF